MELDQKVKDAVKTISDWVEENKDERCFILIMDTKTTSKVTKK